MIDLVFVLVVEDEVENLLGFVLVAHEGLPEEGFDAGDVGGKGSERGRTEDVLDGDDQVFLVVVVGTGSYLPLPLRFLLGEFKNVEEISLWWLPGPQQPGLPRRGGGGLAQGLELAGFGLSLLMVLDGEILINRVFDGFFLLFGQETEIFGSVMLETLKEPYFLHVVILLHLN